MGAIYLVRHGQASFGKADYDQLSDKGCRQSELLGQHLKNKVVPDQFYSGNLLRHEQTANHFITGFGGTDLATVTHSGFNEFNHVEVLVKYRPEWQSHRAMAADIAKADIPRKAFQQAFSEAVIRWVSGHHDADYQETWTQFKARCNSALQTVISQSADAKNIVIFTSGGPISTIVQQILKLGDRETLSINEVLANTSVTKLLFSGDRLSMAYLNNYSHLDIAGDEWLTYR